MHLSTHLTPSEARPAVVADACDLIGAEVSRTSGVSGITLRSAYRALMALRPGMLASAVDSLLDPFADRLDPFYQEHLTTGRPLIDILTEQRTSMAEALLAVTDERAARTKQAGLRRVYHRLRGSAREHVEDAAGGVAWLIDAHTPPPEDPHA